MKRIACFLIIFSFISAAFFSCKQKETRPDYGLNEPLDSLFSSLFAKDEPGAVVMIMHDDSLIYKGAFGLADLQTKTPVTDSTMFNISSASKMYVTVAIMKLAEQGKLSLQDSLSKFFPQYPSPVFNGITIEHVLSHTTGLPD